ncbi:hypothetical protein P175DRAFT_0522348 [Aspergillus ochraceoroseus IBT 24754]|uniref:Calponin-homology (CH) domain-containing protein n=2 Tax=Aspergillus ochraceoroseus TaxID=138278 RepID=A0A2T5M468_9EURO|nr:uncharacterized protein P175DRAFT_0522348 [Aspergillus ochraceoroseus IBT 24754]KKK15552.1 hypothetical protein AOCH_006663 [Aspergillus ochraceoroseus]PTU23322.1 hypothetical protein P175DRAFT_0522348 [Aspergillus ochraceoroseus IBT 24754]
MSRFSQEVATPCPRRSKGSKFGDESNDGSESFTNLWEESLESCDNTMNVDFTTEIRAPLLTGAKPRRKTKASTSFAIHNDIDERPAPAIRTQKRETRVAMGTSNRKTSLLAQPAQRFRPRVSFAPTPLKHTQQRRENEPQKPITKPKTQKNNELLMEINGEGGDQAKDSSKKDIPRNTLYIPPDDNTVASAFMGLFSPLKSNNLDYRIPANTEISSLETQQLARKRQAKLSLSSSPQRPPLQPSTKVAQESYVRVDVAGKNGGKENIPPGMALIDISGKKLPFMDVKKPSDGGLRDSRFATNRLRSVIASNTASKPLAVRAANKSLKKVNDCNRENPKVSIATGATTKEADRLLNTRTFEAVKSSTVSTPLKNSGTLLKASISRNSLKHLNKEYPLICENITNPSMYNDNWLSHQEVILTQLINGLFNHANHNMKSKDSAMLRHEFLSLYQGSYFTTLYKRLQASLLYGALSIPKDILTRNSRLRKDLGMKRKFLDFWLQTYDLRALRAAMETVTGRRILNPKTSNSASQSSINGTASGKGQGLRKRLENALDAFLVQNQDMDSQEHELNAEDSEDFGKAYRRTVLRSIMIVILLDKAQMCHTTAVSSCLFVDSSSYKSSHAVLQGLARFLLPSCGDVIKALSQLDCQLFYEQQPLKEYSYEISNLAVDLRDGVRLTRIIELLLYPSASCLDVECPDAEHSDMTLSESGSESSQWPLSQHLKFPCLSRAVKLFNAKTGLDALASTEYGRQLVCNVNPEDIVDGHREKTIALLWGLVSKWGLSGIIDLKDLKKEIKILRERGASQLSERIEDSESYPLSDETEEPAFLLRHWASLVALLQGVQQESLGTSFADGSVYECIVDEYKEYVLGPSHGCLFDGSQSSLNERLKLLGCSAQFVNLISPGISKTRTLDSESTTGALAFLCSRFLSTTKRVRAATVLQNAWRRVLTCRELQRRIVAKAVAIQCAVVVQTRERILWAKGVILQWWRMAKAKQRRRATRPTKLRPLRRYRY